MRELRAPTLEEIREARERIRGAALRTPLLSLDLGGAGEGARSGERLDLRLKAENLQPIGSFKIRGATNAIASIPRDELRHGVYTASAGNMAQGVAWCARRLGIPCGVVVPDHAPEAKLAAIERLGARVRKVPFEAWWRVMMEHHHSEMEGRFIHPVSDTAVMAGNGTIALEILEDFPDVETLFVPYGGGGLSSGIAAALRALAPAVSVVAAEVKTAAPFAASLAAGRSVPVEYHASFVDGIGGRGVFEEMWPIVSNLLAGSVVVTLEETAAAVRLLAERARIVAEGAGGASVAAALSGRSPAVLAADSAGTNRGISSASPPVGRNVACVVSGGNIDPAKLAAILRGETP